MCTGRASAAPETRRVKVRPAADDDCEAMASIYRESLEAKDCCMETETSAGAFRQMLAGFHQREMLLVLEDGGEVRGWAVVKRYSERPGYRVACETSIYFRRHQTGRGYGSRLQEALLEQCRRFGYHHIVAKIWASNQASIRFHQRFGYQVVGVQKEVGYLGGRWRDVAILQCVLEDVPPYQPEVG